MGGSVGGPGVDLGVVDAARAACGASPFAPVRGERRGRQGEGAQREGERGDDEVGVEGHGGSFGSGFRVAVG